MSNPPPRRTPLALALALALASVVSALGADAPPRLEVEPASVELRSGSDGQQLAVTGRYPDGSVRDLTRSARYSIEGPVAAVSADGLVRPVADGHGLIRVRAAGGSAEASITVRGAEARRPSSYRLDVVATLAKLGCNAGACHGNINGKGGFRLSLRGEDPAADLLAITRDALGRRVDLARPDRSLLVLKPTGRLPHEGGRRVEPGSAEERALLDWIGRGALDDLGSAPRVVRLRVSPEARYVAAPGLSQQLVVTAEFADGTRRDVTRQASFDLNDPTKVSVSPDGLVRCKSPCETAVAIRYLTGRAVSRLAFVADRPGFVARPVPDDDAIDRHVFAKLNALKVVPAEPSTDAVFLRRAHLDAIGVLPTPEEARVFLADPDPGKRTRLVLRLVERPEFADLWALKWADLLRNEEKSMGDKGVWVFHRWLRDQVAADVPLGEFARRVVSTTGSNFRDPPSSFYRTNRDPMTAAETVGQVFLGVRLQCARCHNHPFDVWTQDDYYGLAAYFNNVGRKVFNESRSDALDKHEINGDVVIHLAGRPQMVQPRSGVMMAPKPPGGPTPELHDDPNALDDLADWLTRDNPQFSRNMVNRVWFHLLGRGIVDPVDDFRDSNPPSNPPLLDALVAAYHADGDRLRPLVARIMTSRAYALGPEANESNADDEANFSRALVKLLPAEVLLDAVGQALGKPNAFHDLPATLRATQLPGARADGPFLKTFGKPERLLTCECERSDSTTLAQAFQLINGESIRTKLEAPDNRIGRLLDANATDEAIVDDLFLATLSRPPGASERSETLAHVARGKDRRKAWEDVAWAIVNSKEFLLRH